MKRRYMPGDECCSCICYKCHWVEAAAAGSLEIEVTVGGVGGIAACSDLNGTHILGVELFEFPCRFRASETNDIVIGSGDASTSVIPDMGSGIVSFGGGQIVHYFKISFTESFPGVGTTVAAFGWESRIGFATIINQTEILDALGDLCNGETVELPMLLNSSNTGHCDFSAMTCEVSLP